MKAGNRKIITWSVTVALAGFLFGFDTAVISGADQPIQKLWGLGDLFHGTFIMSMALWGTVIGALFGGIPSERFGRKRTLFWIGILYLVSALGSSLAVDPFTFSFFRFIGGLGVGASSVAAPTYISEIAPTSRRGQLVATYQFNIVLGILIAYLSNFILGNMGDNSWRFMLGAEAIPAIAYLIMVTRIPNSPRWLVIHQKDEDGAKAVMQDIGIDNPEAAIREMQDAQGIGSDASIMSKTYSRPLRLAFLLAFFNQLSGINFIIYYAPRILESAGFGSENALFSTVGIGIANLVFTMIGMYLIDRSGRRSLMLIGSIGYIVSLVLVSVAFYSGNTGQEVIWYLFLFIAAHAIGQGAVIWVFISEIFPNQVRAYGQAFGSFIHWIFAGIITLLMPVVLSRFSGGPIFAFFAVMMVLQLIFVIFIMPETKGVSLEDLQKRLTRTKDKLPAILLLLCCGTLFSHCTNQQQSNVARTSYTEQHRPQFHFSPQEHWMNDPNGMVFYEGEYHLFYQYYPDSTIWGPMHWGHAVSTDLVTWEHLPIGLYPDSLGYIFSGSAVIDWKNTSGLGRNDKPPMIAIFTHHDMDGEKSGSVTYQYQSIAYSNDKGRTWTKYKGNPVIPNPGIRDFRDPKVLWHEDSERWVMVFAAKDRVRFYHSPNLIDWTLGSEFGATNGNHGGVWECPDLFKLSVNGTGQEKDVMLLSINPGGPNGGSATQYFIGDFDGITFIPDPDYILPDEHAVWLDHGRDNYAGVTWSDIPKADGRRLFIGWMSNWDYAQVVPTEKWRSAMTIPRTLTLAETPQGLRVSSNPVDELKALRETQADFPSGTLIDDAPFLDLDPTTPLLVELDIAFSQSTDAEFHLSNTIGEFLRFGYDKDDNAFYIDRSSAGPNAFSDKFVNPPSTMPRVSADETVRMHVFIDASSIEVFADSGLGAMTEIVFPSQPFSQLSVGNTKGLKHEGITIWTLNSIWE